MAGDDRTATSALPISAANSLVPGDLKIVGPVVDFERLRKYIGNVTARAQRVGMKTLVFGSGGARNVPDGFDRARRRNRSSPFAKWRPMPARARGLRWWRSR